MTATTRIVHGRVALDAIALELHDMTGVSHAWDDLGPRDIIGACLHSMVGSLAGTTAYFAGDARYSALTDFGIGGPWDGAGDGLAHQYIPKGSRMSPWANGPANDLEGDGPAFVRVLGVSAVNRNLRSYERSDGGNTEAPFGRIETPKQFLTITTMLAYDFDNAEVPWDTFPKHPRYGITTLLEHFELGPKACPFTKVRGATDAIINASRALMKAAQTGVGTQTPGAVTPIPAQPDKVVAQMPYSTADDVDFLTRRFGSATKTLADGTTQLNARGQPIRYTFNPKGTVSNAWINRSLEDKAFPTLERIFEQQVGTQLRTYFEFADGSSLIDLSDDKRGFFWAGDDAA